MRNPAIPSLLALALVLTPAGAKDKKKMAEDITGTLISMTAPGAMGSRVQIWIEQYTDDATPHA